MHFDDMCPDFDFPDIEKQAIFARKFCATPWPSALPSSEVLQPTESSKKYLFRLPVELICKS